MVQFWTMLSLHTVRIVRYLPTRPALATVVGRTIAQGTSDRFFAAGLKRRSDRACAHFFVQPGIVSTELIDPVDDDGK